VAKDKSKEAAAQEDQGADAADQTAVEAEGAEGEGEGGGGRKKPPLMMLIAAGVGALVVLGGGGTAGVMLLMPHAPASAHKLPPKPKSDKKDDKSDPNAPQVQDGPDGVVYYTLPDLVVNMQTPDGKPTFLKLKLAFECPTTPPPTPWMRRCRACRTSSRPSCASCGPRTWPAAKALCNCAPSCSGASTSSSPPRRSTASSSRRC
jgi:flagellar basal body-associated protein FliL